LKVFAIWTEKLPIDARYRWDAAGMDDPRVKHLWDEQNQAGEWLARNAGAPSDWDFYMVFGSDAEWNDGPQPVIGSGATVLGESESLIKEIKPLIGLTH
jgi:hypothetical protein